jgi:DNA-binding IclR family transcriptional regulator
VQAVSRTLAILDELACYPAGGTPKALAAELGLTVGTVYRLLNTLVARGYVVRDPDTRLFFLGPHLPLLNAALLQSLHVPPRLRQCVEALHRATGESASLVQWWGDEVIASALVEGTAPDSIRGGYVGIIAPAHRIASGKVLLAWAPLARVDSYLTTSHLDPFEHLPPVDPGNVRSELAAIRRVGYALDRESLGWGVGCVAAPVFSPDGRVRYALGLTLAAARFQAEEPALVETVLGIARAATSALQTDQAARSARPPGRRAGKEPLLPRPG